MIGRAAALDRYLVMRLDWPGRRNQIAVGRFAGHGRVRGLRPASAALTMAAAGRDATAGQGLAAASVGSFGSVAIARLFFRRRVNDAEGLLRCETAKELHD